MGARLDLDDSRDAVLLNARHDACKAVACGLRNDGSLATLALPRGLQTSHFGERDEALAAC